MKSSPLREILAFRCNRKKIIPFLILIVLLVSCIIHLSKPITGSHYFRQAQTQQTSDIFFEEGINLLLPKVGFFGKPGYTVLEFPMFQAAAAALAKLTSLGVLFWSRLLTLLSVILLSFVSGATAQILLPFFGLSTKSTTLAPVLLLFSPLVFGMSHWVSIEPLNCAMGLICLYCFTTWMHLEKENKNRFAASLLTVIFCTVSLVLKPHVIVALVPLFAFVFIKTGQYRRTSTCIRILILGAIAFGVAFIWYRYAESVNREWKNPFSITLSHSHYFSWQFTSKNFLTLLKRICIYMYGPVGLFFSCLYFLQKHESKKLHFLLLYSFGSIAFYFFIFFTLNVVHNYYQLAAVFCAWLPIYAIEIPKRLRLCILPIFILSSFVGYSFLVTGDHSLDRTLAFAINKIAPGYSLPSLRIATNNSFLEVVFSQQLHRYTISTPINMAHSISANEQLLVICDRTFGESCRDDTLLMQTRCDSQNGSLEFGNYWICILSGNP